MITVGAIFLQNICVNRKSIMHLLRVQWQNLFSVFRNVSRVGESVRVYSGPQKS